MKELNNASAEIDVIIEELEGREEMKDCGFQFNWD